LLRDVTKGLRLGRILWIKDISFQVKENEMDKACSTNGEKRNAYRILVGKPEGKRPLVRLRHGWIILKWILDRMGLCGLD
jgi:hypothetical protein